MCEREREKEREGERMCVYLINLRQLHCKDQKASNLFFFCSGAALRVVTPVHIKQATSGFRKNIHQMHNYHIHKKPINDEHLA